MGVTFLWGFAGFGMCFWVGEFLLFFVWGRVFFGNFVFWAGNLRGFLGILGKICEFLVLGGWDLGNFLFGTGILSGILVCRVIASECNERGNPRM